MGIIGADSPSDRFPDQLLTASPAGPVAWPRWWVLPALMLACLLPRAVAAWQEDMLVPDAPYYFGIADSLEAGDYEHAFAKLRLNVYPIILMLLHHIGIEHETAGEWWNVLMGAATVLPLFGLVRRQFDERIAILACVLYAFQSRLVIWSREAVRDPTFWFLFMLTMYFFWRATVEVRWRWFVAAGTAWTLAILTRSEAWFFLICAGPWLVWRWLALERGRGRLLTGAVLAAAVPPLLLLAVNVTWLRNHSQWEWGRFRHLQSYQQASHVAPRWPVPFGAVTGLHSRGAVAGLGPMLARGGLLATAATPAAPVPQPAAALTSVESAGPSRAVLLRRFGLRLYKAYDPLFGLLFLVGVCHGWRVLLRRQQLAILVMNVCLVAGVWRYMCSFQEINLRYFFVAVITSTPCAAIGFERLVELTSRVWSRHASWPSARWTMTGALAALVLVGCVARIALPRLHANREQLELGRWALREFGPRQTFVGTRRAGLFEYYSQGKQLTAGRPPDARILLKQVKIRQPAMIVVWQPLRFVDGAFESTLQSRGYHPLAADRLPESCAGIQVYVRDAADRLATPSDPPASSPRPRR